MKIITYNVNRLRAAVSKGLPEWLEQEQADVVCIQETKLQPDQYPEEALSTLGYKHYLYSAQKKGYSGVAFMASSRLTKRSCVFFAIRSFSVTSSKVPTICNLPKCSVESRIRLS